MSELAVEQIEKGSLGAFLLKSEGKRLGEMVYTRISPDQITIEHTEVDQSLRGKGASRKLLDALVAWARASKTRVAATCPYASAQFEKDASIQDVYVR